MNKRLSVIFVLLVLVLFVFNGTSLANHRKRVLGVSSSTDPQLAPTVDGPGFILPDSPFFFVDELKQNVKLAFAFTPEQKAKVRAQIAGEREAELRVMLSKNNEKGVQTALEGISDNLKKAAEELDQAQLAGKNVSKTAKEVNTIIKEKQNDLDTLENDATGELKSRVQAVNQALTESKVKVEDALPENELENEIQDDINRSIEKKVRKATDSVKDVEEDLEELNREAKEAGDKSLKKREEAIRKAIGEKNQELQKNQERLLEAERKKREELLKLQDREATETREVIKKAQEAAVRFGDVKKAIENTRAKSPER